eukprot:CAMPEP_0170882948 /NCGR_PEP_ID=MMETSP0734-20130129/34003_1 /TAXON_ID=186038 /ORGANISM="Fragilariopsis kerguelensis, Strain L26-C5" /LENGTH=295 /DNA_ID=CAMNT_0011267097 /DNA_START=85 /DNA_END=972 /DNA_ORIENTATION=+
MGNCLFCTTTNSNNDDEHAHQEQDEEEESVLQPRIVLLTPEGQKVRSILGMKSEDILQCVINDSNELMNNVAATGEFLSEIRSMSADDVFVRDAQHWQEDEQRAHQEQEDEEENEEEPLLQPRIVLLTPEGLNVRSILAKKPEDLRPCVINTINALMNAIAATGDFLSIVRASLVDDLLLKTEEQYRREQQQQTRGMTITIVHKDWHKIETKYETAVRLFPDILQETWNGNVPYQVYVNALDGRHELQLETCIPHSTYCKIRNPVTTVQCIRTWWVVETLSKWTDPVTMYYRLRP